MSMYFRQILVFYFLIIGVFCHGQNAKGDDRAISFFKDIKTYSLSTLENDSPLIPKTYSHIDFLDARFDTTSIGYSINGRHFQRIAPINGLPLYLKHAIGFKANSSSSTSIFCVIQNFKIIDKDTITGVHYNRLETSNRLHATVDVFVVNQQQYKAAFRFDTMIVAIETAKPYKGVINIFNKALVRRINNINPEKVNLKKAYQLIDLRESIEEKFNLPILNDTSYRKGVYINFTEFINNSPRYTSFQIERSKKFSGIYVKEADSTSSLVTNIFGYSDGEKNWIKKGTDFYLLHKQGKGFSFLAFEYETNYNKAGFSGITNAFSTPLIIGGTTIPMPAPLISSANTASQTAIFRPFTLDMEKGTIF